MHFFKCVTFFNLRIIRIDDAAPIPTIDTTTLMHSLPVVKTIMEHIPKPNGIIG